MQNFYLYQIEVANHVDEQTFNATSPIQVSLARVGEVSTLLEVYADQSGLIGLIRHLHYQGFILLSLSRKKSILTK